MKNTVEPEERVKPEEKVSSNKVLILHNDDWNTFQHVENCLISICNHSPTQASQVALIVHYRGKCDVKRGSESKLKRYLNKLKSENLIVTIEDE